MTTQSHIEVALPAIERNIGVVREAIRKGGGRSSLCAVLKADGYGLGAARISKRLKIAGADMIAVYTPDQAAELVDAAVDLPILVLMPVDTIDRRHTLFRQVMQGRIHFAIHSEDGFHALAELADRQGITLRVHMEVDTGMRRAGVRIEDAKALLTKIIGHPRFELAGLSTHFCSADCDAALTDAQAAAFARWLESVKPLIPPACLIHQASTFPLFRRPDLCATMVRVGLATLGFAGEEFTDRDSIALRDLAGSLRPCVRWLSRIVHSTTVRPGESVGYRATWRAARHTRLGVVPVGYADGYPLALSNTARAGIVGPANERAFVPIVGRISMDQLTVDLTDVPESWLAGGGTVELIGNDRSAPNHLPTLAKQAGTITHEFLCGLSQRVERRYVAIEPVLSTEAIRVRGGELSGAAAS